MECREFLLRYSDYDDSLIPAHEADRFRAHMAECASCARYDRVLRKGRMLARQVEGPRPSPDFIPRLHLRLLELRSRRRGPLSAGLATGLAAATILVVAASAVRVMAPAPAGGAADATVETGAPMSAPSAQAVGPALRARGGERVPTLPAAERRTPRSWTTRKVAPAVAASYSPLETGPPAYRAGRPSSYGTTDPGRGLD